MKREEIIKQRDILRKISQASDAIRQKHKMLKLGKDTAEKAMSEMFKPIVTPLQSLVDSSPPTSKQKIKEEIKQEIKQENSSLKDLSEHGNDDDDDDGQSLYDSIISQNNTGARSKNLDDTLLSRTPTSTSTPAKTGDLSKSYINKFNSFSNEIDSRYGVRRKFNKLFIGDSNIAFKDNKIMVQDKSYPMTSGLLELLFKKSPIDSLVTQNDRKKYFEILEKTNTHRKHYKADGEIFIDSTPKFDNYIADFLAKHNYSSSGGGIPNLMIARKKKTPIDYVYWDDPNELIDRLRLLMASQAAGNPSHTNEIISIIEELREAEIIY
ncbi:uncharacterized protein LOC130676312 [Microplitis mediator]|uniref:uncharacterized protein LOC130668876 n=1 Tax=Microplitis mediator TaxID=375433 RepID=UPI002554443B|nr:uncharacterized protein LOC130668876 [Microplitis mediator]XP_057330866.1 uncharacterized protein LOC130671161 [Microplitis mediator]XP_057338448.1 uncharacterized protein LOC130676312 [Microplitis mediator]